MLAVAMLGCMQPGMDRPADAADTEIERAEATRGGSSCTTNNNEVELCSTAAGSSYPDEHDGTKFPVTLEFSEAVTMHARSVPGIVSIRYGAIRNVVAVDASLVYLADHRPGDQDWAASQSTTTWQFWVHPAPNHSRVVLIIRNHSCDHRNAICSTLRYRVGKNRYHKPLKATTKIEVFYEDPNPQAPNTDPPGPVRNVRAYGNHAGWQAPAAFDHGGAFITEYRILAGGCDGLVGKTLRHPDDFWMHGGHDGYYHISKGWRGAVGVQAVNEHGAGPCVDSS